MKHLAWVISSSLAVCCLFAGCEQGPAIAPVIGVVKHDGQPLANAEIEFQPDKGAPSYAYTNEDGSYDLQYQMDRRGALLGHHYVSVKTKGEVTDPKTDRTVNVPETVPVKYNDDTILEFTVEKRGKGPRGVNIFNINVEGKRERGYNRGF